MKTMARRIVVEIAVFAFVALFVYAALSKLLDFQKFYIQVSQSPMLTAHAGAIVRVVPISELVISLLIIVERTRLTGLYAAFGMMVMFTGYIVLASRFSDYVPCSCGGVLERLTWTEHLLFNIVFMVLGAAAILLYGEGGAQNGSDPTDTVSASRAAKS